MNLSRMHVGIVGLGAMGDALARALRDVSSPACRLVAVSSRRGGAAEALAAQLDGVAAVPLSALAAHVDVVLLTVGDPEVSVLAADPAWTRGLTVVHTSGALGLAALEAAAHAGAAVGSFHPLVPTTRRAAGAGLAHADQAGAARAHFAGATVALDGTPAVLDRLEALAQALHMHTLVVPEAWRARWHAAATLVGNVTTALVAHADHMLRDLPVDATSRRAAMTGMLTRVATDLAALPASATPAAAIAGPVARGDSATVERHLAALSGVDAAAYRNAASLILLAVGDALPDANRHTLTQLLDPSTSSP